MSYKKILFSFLLVLVTMAFFFGINKAAAQSSPASEQTPKRHDIDAVLQRQARRITPGQRRAAADRLRQEREARDPSARARRLAARQAAAQSAEARIEALNNPKSPDVQVRLKKARDISVVEAAARRAAARDARIQGGI